MKQPASNNVKYCKDLIAIMSMSGHEEQVFEYISLKTIGIGKRYKLEKSLTIHITGINTKKAFILNGHVDTVDTLQNPSWMHDPLTANIMNDVISGLGASDMKSGVAIMLSILLKYKQNKPPVDLWFMFAGSEETDGSGTKQCLEHFSSILKSYETVGGVILEPTDASTVGIGHRGNVFCKLSFSGVGGHGSENIDMRHRAIMKCADFMSNIESIQKNWIKKYSDKTIGEPTINITAINGGNFDSPNIVTDTVELMLDIRTTPKLSSNLDHTLKDISDKFKFAYNLPHGVCGDGQCGENAYVLSVFKSVVSDVTYSIFNGASDMCFYTERGIDMVIYGPGKSDTMHKPNESVSLVNINKVESDITKIIEKF